MDSGLVVCSFVLSRRVVVDRALHLGMGLYPQELGRIRLVCYINSVMVFALTGHGPCTCQSWSLHVLVLVLALNHGRCNTFIYMP